MRVEAQRKRSKRTMRSREPFLLAVICICRLSPCRFPAAPAPPSFFNRQTPNLVAGHPRPPRVCRRCSRRGGGRRWVGGGTRPFWGAHPRPGGGGGASCRPPHRGGRGGGG